MNEACPRRAGHLTSQHLFTAWAHGTSCSAWLPEAMPYILQFSDSHLFLEKDTCTPKSLAHRVCSVTV